MKKKCKKCGERKLLEDFYIDKRISDGRRNACKECMKKSDQIWYIKNHKRARKNKNNYRAKNLEKARLHDRIRSRVENMTEERIVRKRKTERRWVAENKERARETNRLRKRGKKGKAYTATKTLKGEKPIKCSICNTESDKLHGHHPDYDKPFEVVWCCPQCHGRIHRIDNQQAIPSEVAL